MAEDFRSAFGLWNDGTTIGHIDIAGVNFAGVKALEARTAELAARTAEVERLRAEVAELRARMAHRGGAPALILALRTRKEGEPRGARCAAGLVAPRRNGS